MLTFLVHHRADLDSTFNNDKAAIMEWAPQFPDQVYAITVGSETLYRGNFTGPQLLAKIQDVKSSLPQYKVGTADSWNKYADGTADALITGGVDILLCNAFSYWQGQDISNATGSYFDDIMQAFGHIQSVAGSTDKIELWTGETGWPTAGTQYQNAVPGTDAAARYFSQAVCGMLDWGFNTFFFEAFDEPQKPPSIGQDGKPADETHWGAMNADRSTKYSLQC
jgi:glucan 1,3-beta-glucosidase